MTKKEKILHSYITNIIEDENPKNIFILTSQDISKLVKRIEKLSVDELSIGPSIEKLSDENFDLFIILDDLQASESNIGTIKIAQKIGENIYRDFLKEMNILNHPKITYIKTKEYKVNVLDKNTTVTIDGEKVNDNNFHIKVNNKDMNILK